MSVTTEWLESLGFRWNVGYSLEIFRPEPQSHIGVRFTASYGRLWLMYGNGASCLYNEPTRDDVLTLCKALGIPLNSIPKETP